MSIQTVHPGTYGVEIFFTTVEHQSIFITYTPDDTCLIIILITTKMVEMLDDGRGGASQDNSWCGALLDNNSSRQNNSLLQDTDAVKLINGNDDISAVNFAQ